MPNSHTLGATHRSPPLAGATRAVAFVAAAMLVALPSVVWADGWHNASLATASLDDWLRDIRASVPEVADRLDKSQLKSGASIDDLKKANRPASEDTADAKPIGGKLNNLSQQQQAVLSRKAADCMEVLAYMDTKNIFPREFPTFQLGKIPEYRKTAKQLLGAMGPLGAQAIANQLRAELMGGVNHGYDVSPTASYYDDLLEVFKQSLENGDLSMEDAEALQDAASGMKSANAGLAKKVKEMIDQYANLKTLVNWLANTSDGNRKKQLTTQIKARVAKASQEELLAVLSEGELDSSLKSLFVSQAAKNLPAASVTELLGTMEEVSDAALKRSAAAELAKRSPTYASVSKELPSLVTFSRSADATVAKAAEGQLANAFQRAPMTHCLYWLGQKNSALNSIIWQQVDTRIARADAERRASYSQAALTAIGHKEASLETKKAGLQLLERMQDQDGARAVVDLLPQLPRDLWPAVGTSLEKITGQRFGPKTGDGAAEVTVSVKKWRDWFATKGK
jgi:hypothetical protein